jgi:hypothetical protein
MGMGMVMADSQLIAAFRAVLAKAREIEADSRNTTITFRLHELGVVARIQRVVPKLDPADGDPVTYIRAAEQIALWRELERETGRPAMVLRLALERAVADVGKGVGP